MNSAVQVYWVKRIDNTRLVRQRHPGAVRETRHLAGGALLCLAILLLCAWQHFQFVHAGYRLEELRRQHEESLEWNRTLRLEQAALLDPMRVDYLARQRLGLETPEPRQVIPLGTGERPVGVPVLARANPTRPARRASFAD